MTLEKAIQDLKKGEVAPCYLLYGEEEYLIGEALQQMLDILVPPGDRDFGLFMLDGENTDIDLLKIHLLAPSLLGNRKVVVVRNTLIFQSRENLSDLIRKIRSNLDEHPDKAYRYFQAFLKLSGFSWEDMQAGSWQKISDEQWRKAVEDDSGEDRHTWLPRIIEICASRGGGSVEELDFSEQFENLLKEGFPAGNALILTAETIDKRKKIFKTLDREGVILHFGEIKGEVANREKLKIEAKKLLGLCNKSLSPAAWTVLARKTGSQLRPSLNELEKLISYVGNRPVIEEEDVETVVGKTREDTIFDLTSALSEKNSKAALFFLKTLLDQGTHHLMILTMISREIRFLFQASVLIGSGQLPRLTPGTDYGSFQKSILPAVVKLASGYSRTDDILIHKHPFVVYNAMRHCNRFSASILSNCLDDLVDIDRAMKSSAIDPQILLERFLVKVCTTVS